MSEVVTRLLETWDAAAATTGVLRSSPHEAQLRVLEGPLGIVVIYNPSHSQRKRPVDQELLRGTALSSASPPSSAFNFTYIQPNEVLCSLTVDEKSEQAPPQVRVHVVDALSSRHAVLVNVSPLMRGHSLIVFDVAQLKPQRLELPYLRASVAVVLAARDPHFALGFNSAGAWSSVNHLHLQCLFSSQLGTGRQHQLPILRQHRREIFQPVAHGHDSAAVTAFEFPDWPMRCYGVSGRVAGASDAVFNGVVRVAWTLLQLLQTRRVPHNVLLAYDDATSQPLVIVFPRQQQRENGGATVGEEEEEEGSEPTTGSFRFAIAEVAGLVVAGTAASYRHMSQEMYARIMRNKVSLSKEETESIVDEWKRLL